MLFVVGLYGSYLASSPLTYFVAALMTAIPLAWVAVAIRVAHPARPIRPKGDVGTVRQLSKRVFDFVAH